MEFSTPNCIKYENTDDKTLREVLLKLVALCRMKNQEQERYLPVDEKATQFRVSLVTESILVKVVTVLLLDCQLYSIGKTKTLRVIRTQGAGWILGGLIDTRALTYSWKSFSFTALF